MRTHPGLAAATAIFRSPPLREQASILRAQAENPRLPAVQREKTLRSARNAEKLADWHDKQSQPQPGQDAARRP